MNTSTSLNAASTAASTETAMPPVVASASTLRQVYPISRGPFSKPDQLQAVGGVSFTVRAGRTLAVVGESGCGKSTLARMVSLIEKPTAGQLTIAGVDVVGADAKALHALRQKVQLVFQNPYGSLNPRKRIGQILEAPLEINTDLTAAQRAEKARAMLAMVGLRPEHFRDPRPRSARDAFRQGIGGEEALFGNLVRRCRNARLTPLPQPRRHTPPSLRHHRLHWHARYLIPGLQRPPPSAQ